MALIHVPKPPKSAYDPNRPLGSLLRSQVEHLREAESKLPLRYRSELYVKAIHTEAEAAQYIHDVTEAIHEAHGDAERKRQAPPKRKRVIEIAAVADERAERGRRSRPKRTTKLKSKKSAGTKRRKK